MSREDQLWEDRIREEHESRYGLVEKIPTEDKIISAREEFYAQLRDYSQVRELTPGEIARIVNNALRDLPDELIEESGAEIAEVCQEVAYQVMSKMIED